MCNPNNFAHYTENHESVTGLFAITTVSYLNFEVIILFLLL